MKLFFDSTAFRYLVFPLSGIVFRIFVKLAAKNPPFERRDFAVGLEVMSDALLMFVALDLERAVGWTKTTASLRNVVDPVEASGLRAHADVLINQIAFAGVCIFVIFFVLMVLAFLKRVYTTDVNGKPSLFGGIVLPDVVGFLSLATVAWYFSN